MAKKTYWMSTDRRHMRMCTALAASAPSVVAMGSPVWWKTARQPVVTLSTAESEPVAVTEGYVAGRSVEGFFTEAFTLPGVASVDGRFRWDVTTKPPSRYWVARVRRDQ